MDGSEPLRMAVVIGSNREGRLGPTVARWFLQVIADIDGLDVDTIDLADLDLHTRIGTDPPETTQSVSPVLRPQMPSCSSRRSTTTAFRRR
jgi:NAD(P)H-dependent FMN reductase